MPADFLSADQKRCYGRFVGDPSPTQLARAFHLDDTARALVEKRRGDQNRLGFALQLTTVRFLGTFLHDPTQVPAVVVDYVARQLGISDVSGLGRYLDRRPTRHTHAAEIRQAYGYREFTVQPEHFQLVRWLYVRAWMSAERPSLLFDLATAWLVARKILLPGVTTLTRLINHVRDRAAARLWKRLAAALSGAQKQRLAALLVVPDGARHSHMDRLRQGPSRVSGPALVAAAERLEEVRAVGVGRVDLRSIPPARVAALARYAASAWAPTIARMSEDRRVATLLAFARTLEATALDDTLDLLVGLVTEILAQAERLWKKERLRTIKDLDRAALTLRDACWSLLDDQVGDSDVREAAFSRVARADVSSAMARVAQLARPTGDRYHQEIVDRYRRVRGFLPKVLETIRFEGTPAGRPVLRALEFLRSIEGTRRPDMSAAPLDVVPRAWKRRVVDRDGLVDRRAYTLCTVQQLHDALRRRSVFVPGSGRWGDPRTKLLRGTDWTSARMKVCQSLGLEPVANQELRSLGSRLDDAYRRAIDHLPQNTAVHIEREAGKDALVLTPLEKLDEPLSLTGLRDAVAALLPRVDLPEVLLEMHVRTGFADEFTHVSEHDARVVDLPVSLCAVLLAEACNIGLAPLVRRGVPALTRGRLTWVQQNYMRAETLTQANARLVDAHAAIPLVRAWGGGEVASADGLRFVTPLRTVSAGPNPKYFGSKRGITYYNFTSDQFTGFHGIVVPGTLRDSMFILEGLLEQQTTLRPTEIMTDTAGASDMVFGLFWLLGFQFSPRLADLGDARFWRLDRDADYGPLNHISRHRVITDRIAGNWDDMLRVAGSLTMGTVSASELIRSLLRSDRPSTLASAIGDLGRIAKTLHRLAYLDDDTYRRRILTQLNRGEARHALARALFHGRRGEVRRRYREGQEDQLSALGLVVNVLVLWNTTYMGAAIEHLKRHGTGVAPDDVARLSPLEHQNVNFLGQYSFALSDAVAQGQLRPLRDAAEE